MYYLFKIDKKEVIVETACNIIVMMYPINQEWVLKSILNFYCHNIKLGHEVEWYCVHP